MSEQKLNLSTISGIQDISEQAAESLFGGSSQSETVEMLKLQKATMEYSILVNVYTNSINSLKDGLSAVARNI